MILTKNILFEEYINKKKTSYEIAKHYNYHPCTIIVYLRKFGIPVRTSGESQKGKARPIQSQETIEKIRQFHLGRKRSIETRFKLRFCKLGKKLSLDIRKKMSNSRRKKFGKDVSQYIDGRTPLKVSIRRDLYLSKEWRIKVFKRDNYTCQNCNQRGNKLEAHHIITFSFLLNKFLKKYSNLCPLNNREDLLKLAIKYKPFWNIKNGKTLCKNCHKLITFKKD